MCFEYRFIGGVGYLQWYKAHVLSKVSRLISILVFPAVGRDQKDGASHHVEGPDGLSPYHIPKMEDAFAPGYVSKALQFRHGKEKKTR